MATPASENFAEQLRDLGYEPEVMWEEVVVFGYEVPLGKHLGEIVKIGIHVPAGWSTVPPSGPFVSPRVLPINPAQGRGRPWDAVHEANGRTPFQDPNGEWEYWSRPFPTNPGWANTDQSVGTYLTHLRTLFDEIPEDA
jgi:hypothetical protein